MGKKKNTAPTMFDVSSSRFCVECKRNIRIAFGEENWKSHLQSRDHLKNMATPKSNVITNFFSKMPGSSSSTDVSKTSVPLNKTLTASPLLLPQPNAMASVSVPDPHIQGSRTPPSLHGSSPQFSDPGLTLLAHIRAGTMLLPGKLPLGTPQD
ncbi:hypothetical protein EDD85DRAFT_955914 [Armillaria nabsnona]|nr:hypothetical protein EDD85DRAFT_955914 [Armillaria nabsnona]